MPKEGKPTLKNPVVVPELRNEVQVKDTPEAGDVEGMILVVSPEHIGEVTDEVITGAALMVIPIVVVIPVQPPFTGVTLYVTKTLEVVLLIRVSPIELTPVAAPEEGFNAGLFALVQLYVVVDGIPVNVMVKGDPLQADEGALMAPI